MPLPERIARLGRRGRVFSARLDLLGFVGPGHYLRRLLAQRSYSRLGETARDALYDRIWRAAAAAVGADAVSLGPGRFELIRDGSRARVSRQAVGLDDDDALRLAMDKAQVHRLLIEAQATVPEHLEFGFDDQAPALSFMDRIDGPCVVKPAADTAGGHGVTAGIVRPSDLRRACVYAAQQSDRLLIERQAVGAVYRLLFLDGELLDVVRSVPDRLTGDGSSTIAELMRIENRRRVAAGGAAGLAVIGIDLDLVLTLESAGLSLSSVPADGESVAIRSITNASGISQCETYRGELAESVLAEARTAIGAVGLTLAGVDVITADPTRPLDEVGGAINEVNGNPGLHHHYLVADPERATPVAIPILERVLS